MIRVLIAASLGVGCLQIQMTEEKANRETEEMLGGGGFDQSQSQTHKSFVGSPCTAPVPAQGGGRLLWAGMLGGPKAGL